MKKIRGIENSKSDLCTVQIACDGNYLQQGRQICGKCEQAQKRRAKSPALKGERYMDYAVSRARVKK